MTIPLETWDMHNKWILLRIDANVPLENDKILDDNRLQEIVQTIDYILAKKGHIILLTHIGRPKDHEKSLSTKNLMPWFLKKYTIDFAQTFDDIERLKKAGSSLILFENLRFFAEEKALSLPFAQKLAALGDFYVNDAFGTLHRDHTSITLLAEQFPAENRSMGFLVAKEFRMLNGLIYRNTHPSLIVLGGAKLETKIPLINALIDYTDTLFIGPALSFTFMKSQGIAVGKSLVEDHLVDLCRATLAKAAQSNCSLMLPQDYLISLDTTGEKLCYTQTQAIPDDAVGISIGEKTIKKLEDIIKKARVIFFNGSMGFSEKPETMLMMKKILTMLNRSQSTTVLAGGDTVSYARAQNLVKNITHLSTGGGATISYLINKQLPGLRALHYRAKSQ